MMKKLLELLIQAVQLGSYDSSDVSTTMASPLYITVGPPCAGKTTWIANQEDDIQDVSIDDQEGVYTPVPIAWYLDQASSASDARKMVLHGKTASERIQTETEVCTILKRLSSSISKSECEAKIGTNAEGSRTLLNVVETYLEQHEKIQLPETMDLFCVEALFRPDPTLQRSAIDRANAKLCAMDGFQSIAWGNTNCRSTDYQGALAAAVQKQRPVYFIVYSETNTDGLYAENLQDLFQRSIDRLVKTGRYVPSKAIVDMRRRCLEMVGNRTGMELESHLAQIAGYDLDPTTRLVRAHPPSPKRQRPSGPYPHHYGPRPRRGSGRYDGRHGGRGSRGGGMPHFGGRGTR